MDKLIVWMERAGGLFLFVITVLIAVSSTTRYLFNWPLPDADSLGRLLLGTVVFWGLAGACRHQEHIRVDLLWEQLGPRGRALLDAVATLLTLAGIGLLAVAAWTKVVEYAGNHEVTYDLRLAVWPFYGLAWIGLLATVAVLVWGLLRRSHDAAR